MLIIVSGEAAASKPSLPYNGKEELVEFVRDIKKKKIIIERSYKIETEENLVLAPGQAASLDFEDNAARIIPC